MEILVRLVDRSGVENDSKRGDVIAVQPDGWAWSADERANPAWMLIKVISLLDTDRDSMLLVHADGTLAVPSRRRREWFLDLNSAPLPGRFAFPRTQESVTMTRLGVAAILTQKPALV